MIFKIIERAPEPEDFPKHGFYLSVYVSIPGTTYDTIFTFGPFKKGKDESILAEMIRTLKRMKAHYPSGKAGYEDYLDVWGFRLFFTTYPEREDENYKKIIEKKFGCSYQEFAEYYENFIQDDLDWVHDNQGVIGSLDNYEVEYLNEQNVLNDVQIIESTVVKADPQEL